MTNSRTIKSLQQHNLAPHKRFGQNFLVNKHTAQAIVNCGNISAGDSVLEVGVGLGALTNLIAEKADRVLGVEIDSGLIRYHETEKDLRDNVVLIHDDILKTNFSHLSDQCGGPLKIMANLPYSISNPFIFKLIENRQYIDWVVVMLQKEVAERLTALPSTKQYGIPTVLLSGYAEVKKLLTVKPHEFHPQPKVDSLVIRINFSCVNQKIESFSESEHKIFQQTVRSAFAKRRKTLLNNLSNLDLVTSIGKKKCAKDLAQQIIQGAGIKPQERAENLTLEQFAALADSAARILRSRQLEKSNTQQSG